VIVRDKLPNFFRENVPLWSFLPLVACLILAVRYQVLLFTGIWISNTGTFYRVGFYVVTHFLYGEYGHFLCGNFLFTVANLYGHFLYRLNFFGSVKISPELILADFSVKT
jgi:hypothetical protein